MVAAMTSRQRVLAALRREPVDRTPACNPTSVATVELMDLASAPFPHANRQPELMAAVEENEAPLMGMSALLTTTMPNMEKTIEAFIDADLRDQVKIMVGGAPVTQEFADEMGADGYGKDAMACVALAKRLMGVEAT